MLNGLGSCGGGRSRTSARQPSGYSSQARLRKRAVAAGTLTSGHVDVDAGRRRGSEFIGRPSGTANLSSSLFA